MFHNDLYCKNLIIQKEQNAKLFPSKKADRRKRRKISNLINETIISDYIVYIAWRKKRVIYAEN